MVRTRLILQTSWIQSMRSKIAYNACARWPFIVKIYLPALLSSYILGFKRSVCIYRLFIHKKQKECLIVCINFCWRNVLGDAGLPGLVCHEIIPECPNCGSRWPLWWRAPCSLLAMWRLNEILSSDTSSKWHLESQLGTVLEGGGGMLDWQKALLSGQIFFQKAAMRASSDCQSHRRKGNKNSRGERLSPRTLCCELSLFLAGEFPPRSACSRNTACWVCVSGLGKPSEVRAGFPDCWDLRDSFGHCRISHQLGLGYTHGVNVFPVPCIAKWDFTRTHRGHKRDILSSFGVRVLAAQCGALSEGILRRKRVSLSSTRQELSWKSLLLLLSSFLFYTPMIIASNGSVKPGWVFWLWWRSPEYWLSSKFLPKNVGMLFSILVPPTSCLYRESGNRGIQIKTSLQCNFYP